MKRCPDCCAQFPDTHLFCPVDGADLVPIAPLQVLTDSLSNDEIHLQSDADLQEIWEEAPEDELTHACDLCEHPLEETVDQCPNCGARRHGRWPLRKDDSVPFPYIVALLEDEEDEQDEEASNKG